jgi:hypothetical protein
MGLSSLFSLLSFVYLPLLSSSPFVVAVAFHFHPSNAK